LQYNGNSAPVEGFYVYYLSTSSAADYFKETVEGPSLRFHTVTHLDPDKSYDFKVQAFNTYAASDFTEILTHKTEREFVFLFF